MESELRKKYKEEYIGLKFMGKTIELTNLFKQDTECSSLDNLKKWIYIENNISEYRNYKTALDDEMVNILTYFLLGVIK